MIEKSNPIIKESYQFSIAPMLDCTDRHFRVLIRQITKKALVYSEMIVAKALQYKTRSKLLNFDEIEHPIALQLGGDDPKILSEAAAIAESWGYDEINLNLLAMLFVHELKNDLPLLYPFGQEIEVETLHFPDYRSLFVALLLLGD